MKAQLSLVYNPSTAGREAWLAHLEVLRSAVSHLGLKEVSFAIDVSGSMLSDALNERDRKRWAGEWTLVIQAMLRNKYDPIAFDLLHKVASTGIGCTPFCVQEEDEITPEDEAVWQRVEAAKRRKARNK